MQCRHSVLLVVCRPVHMGAVAVPNLAHHMPTTRIGCGLARALLLIDRSLSLGFTDYGGLDL